MKRINRTLLLFVATSLIFSSCQKEVDLQNDLNPGAGNGNGGGGTTSNRSIIGDYDFINVSAHTKATLNASEAGIQMKTITTSDYVSKNNSGTAKFTAAEFIMSNVKYDIDTIMYGQTYMNGVFMGDTELPFQVPGSLTNGTATYKLIGTDSVYMSSGISTSAPLSGNTTGGPAGYKLSWSGDTLIMKINATSTQTITQQGVTGTLVGEVNGVVRLKKK